MPANALVLKTVVAVTPGTECQRFVRIGADSGMRPVWGDNHNVTGTGINGKTTPGVILGKLLHIDNRFARPDFINLRSRPLAEFGNPVNMSLATYGFPS